MKHDRLLLLFFFLILLIGGLMVTNKVRKISEGIAHAEGFFADGDTLPKRANNPGDLKEGDKGNGMIAGKTVFATVADGWTALYKQVGLILTGLSAHYKPSMTISEVAVIWTGSDNADAWANTVAQYLGVETSTPIGEV